MVELYQKGSDSFFWALNTVIILLFIVGALSVLHPKGIVPSKGTLIWDEAQIFGIEGVLLHRNKPL